MAGFQPRGWLRATIVVLVFCLPACGHDNEASQQSCTALCDRIYDGCGFTFGPRAPKPVCLQDCLSDGDGTTMSTCVEAAPCDRSAINKCFRGSTCMTPLFPAEM